MKIKLNTDSVKKFVQLSSGVELGERKTFAPLSYLRFSFSFGMCEITKANIESFCKYTFDCGDFMEDAVIFIDNDVLTQMLTNTKQKTFTIEVDSNFVWLKDGYYKFKFGVQDVNDLIYPKMQDAPEDFIRLNLSAMKAIQTLKIAIATDELRPKFMAVYVDKDYVYSTDMFTILVKKIEDIGYGGLVAASKKECAMLSQFQYIDFVQTESHNIYKYEDALYGFTKRDGLVGWEFNEPIKTLSMDNFAKLKCDDIINFCQTTISLNKGKISTSQFSAQNGKVELSFHDLDTGLENQLTCDCELVGDSFSFLFEPDRLLGVIKSIGYSDICIGNEKWKTSIWNQDDDSFVGLIVNVSSNKVS